MTFQIAKTPMTVSIARPVTPRDVARVLFRHWRKMALFFCAVAALTLLVVALYPRSYKSEAKLFIRVGRESVALDPTATTGDTIMIQKTQADEINSALNLLSSREILRRAVDIVGVDRILNNAPEGDSPAAGSTSPSSWLSSMMASLHLSDPGTDSDKAIRQLETGVKVWAPKESTVITLSYTASSPQLAHDIVEAITKVFIEERIRLTQSDGSLAFFSEQADKLYAELTAAQSELRDRKNAFERTAGETHRSILEETKDATRQKLRELEIQESDLKSRYTDAFPPLAEIRRQRAEAEKKLMEVSSPSTKATATSGAASQNNLQSEVQTLNDQELQLSQLDRKVKLLDNKYHMHMGKLEQARVNEAMGREQISNVKIAQPATLVSKPVSPKKALFVAMGFMVAIGGALGLAYFSESIDQTLRTTDQVESQLGLPVLMSLPYRSRRRRTASKTARMTTAKPNGQTNGQNVGQRRYGYQALVRELLPVGETGRRRVKTVGVVGCDSSKVRSRVAANLAMHAANCGTEPVLLVDADSRRSWLAKRFQLTGLPGWRDVMAGSANAESCIHHPNFQNLSVMTSGGTNADAPANGNGQALAIRGQLDEIKTDYGLVVVDLPPGSELNAPAAGEWLDEMVLVVDAERTRIQAAQHAKDMLRRAGVNVTGVVLANRREHIPRWLYQRL